MEAGYRLIHIECGGSHFQKQVDKNAFVSDYFKEELWKQVGEDLLKEAKKKGIPPPP